LRREGGCRVKGGGGHRLRRWHHCGITVIAPLVVAHGVERTHAHGGCCSETGLLLVKADDVSVCGTGDEGHNGLSGRLLL